MADGTAAGTAPAVLGGGLAQLLVLPAGDDVVVVDVSAGGVTVVGPEEPRPDAPRGPGRASTARRPRSSRAGDECSSTWPASSPPPRPPASPPSAREQAAAYAKARVQFGRPIAMFQAVKHHCANMLVAAELATAAVWDAARAAGDGGDQLSLAAAMAATLALAAADECANLNIQVHGGIGFTWEHDAHLYLRRATALEAFVDAEAAAARRHRPGARRRARASAPSTCRPRPSRIRDEVRAFAEPDQGPRRGGAARRHDRDRLRHAALARALGPRRRRGGAARDRAGVRGGRRSPRPSTASPAGSS